MVVLDVEVVKVHLDLLAETERGDHLEGLGNGYGIVYVGV